MKPTGMTQVLPRRRYGGTALVSGGASQGLTASAAAGCLLRRGIAGIASAGTGRTGITGDMLATSAQIRPQCLFFASIAFSSIFCCCSIACCSVSSCFCCAARAACSRAICSFCDVPAETGPMTINADANKAIARRPYVFLKLIQLSPCEVPIARKAQDYGLILQCRNEFQEVHDSNVKRLLRSLAERFTG